MNTLARRIAALERRRPQELRTRTVILFPGESEPEELPGELLIIIRPFDALDPEEATA